MPTIALTVAGSDPSGGAGVQADLATFHAFGVHGAAVLTALTVQNTIGVRDVHVVDAAFVGAQLDAVLEDLPIGAVKTGMLGSAAVVEAVAARLGARPALPLVVDPVLAAGGGEALAEPSLIGALRARLLPLAVLVTPNLAETEALLGGGPVRDVTAMRAAAQALVTLGARAALVKGGHLTGRPVDVLCDGGRLIELDAPRVGEAATHGTGCALSAAITAGLAAGRPVLEAVRHAKDYLGRALAAAVPLGRGRRSPNPLIHPGTI